jgi:DNA invertase Pin-like site-specific DNA recombinase
MNIVTYLRVSTEDQRLEPQRLELAEFCGRMNWTIEAEYSDVISGAKAERSGLDALLERCALGGVDAVVVVKLDRLGRSLLNVIGLVQKLKDMGTSVVCTSQGIDTRDDNPCGKMMMAVLAACSEFERNLIVERTKAGLRAARARGKVLGRPSEKLVADWPAVVAAWHAETGGRGLRRLALRLGGVSTATAAAKYREWRAAQ